MGSNLPYSNNWSAITSGVSLQSPRIARSTTTNSFAPLANSWTQSHVVSAAYASTSGSLATPSYVPPSVFDFNASVDAGISKYFLNDFDDLASPWDTIEAGREAAYNVSRYRLDIAEATGLINHQYYLDNIRPYENMRNLLRQPDVLVAGAFVSPVGTLAADAYLSVKVGDYESAVTNVGIGAALGGAGRVLGGSGRSIVAGESRAISSSRIAIGHSEIGGFSVLGPADDVIGTLYNTSRRLPATAVAPSRVPLNPGAYSTAFETQLPTSVLGKSRAIHFNRANAALDQALGADAQFAGMMDDLIPGVRQSVSSVGGRQTPTGWTWEHVHSTQAGGEIGVMRLVPTPLHTPGSPFWNVIHAQPGGVGGYSEWAIPRGAPPNR